jgi:hypothetical protein
MLPSYEDTLDKFSKFGLSIKPLSFSQIWETPDSWMTFLYNGQGTIISRFIFFGRYLLRKNKPYYLSYPLIGSYSDIFIISANSIKEFCRYCGIFAATDLFVELALPTALVLSSDEIVTEKDLDLQGKPLWTNENYQELEKYGYSLSKLLSDFPPKYIYLHPIKLSKWKRDY